VNPERIEIQSQRQDGEILPLELAVTKVRLGQQTMLIIMLHDLSKTKRAERLKSEFVSAVSHELRTPLTSIRGVLGLLVGGVGEVIPPKTRGLLSMANENAIRLTKLINDLLDFDKLEYGGMQFDMQTYAVRTLVEKRSLRIRVTPKISVYICIYCRTTRRACPLWLMREGLFRC
jgi:signal transduction histidine kinase